MDWPKSQLILTCHPHVDQIKQDVDDYFLQHWEFPNEKSRQKFLGAKYPRATCMNFPLTKDDRISFACRLFTVLFLIDGKMYYAS